MLGKGIQHRNYFFITHSTLPKHQIALVTFATHQKIAFIILLIGFIVLSIIFSLHTLLVILISLLTILYFTDLLFNLFLIIRSFHKPPEIDIEESELAQAADKDWPSYSIFCPLYKEKKVLPQFVKAISNMDYPKNKLEVLLILEEDDRETISTAFQLNLPDYFRIIVVPHSLPKTKPKALNYGLAHAVGEYAVIYDAEDIPDPNQLKKAVLAFRKVDSKVICLQAKLNFYNPTQNILTKVFTAEYSLWFDLVLTGLQSIHAPIPLGGTSNHFRTKDLRLLEGWDPFNVTEDCDLGIRICKRGYHTAIFNSTTLEEANSNFFNWLRQRSRWIKGYIQTYLVHMRRPGEFISDWRQPHVITFQLIVGGKVASIFINPIMWLITVSYFAFRPIIGTTIESFFGGPIFYMAVFCLVIGNFLYMYYYMIGCYKREQWDIIQYVFLVPFYWLMMSVASWIAFYQLFLKPHYWEKTHHGLHLTESKKTIGAELIAT